MNVVFGWLRKRPRLKRSIELVLAGDESDACAVLTMIARYHGRDVEIATVGRALARVAESPDSKRYNGRDVLDAAADLGLSVRGMKVSHHDAMVDLTYPCVAHLGWLDGGGQFVVLGRFDGVHLSIFDPFGGVSYAQPEDFWRRASGIFLVFEPGAPIPRATLRG